ncbi:thioredoxin family protein [Salipaludibacillus daqingensis]|uniref:thioredoxin family protein n=1 Tax=Salipaludibacillus daqingensis TaxID=3041001 RepID=UPI0024756F94|nr:thioredoxin family protein [Salipaludibacillus daqingensis]
MDSPKSIKEFTDFITTQEIAILLVKTDACSVCDAVEQQMEHGAIHNIKVPIVKVRLEDVPEISGQYLVFTAPTILLFIKGKEYWRGSRFISYEELNRTIDKFYK